jgi:hypothetical protein
VARLRNVKSGAVVSVTDEKAARLGSEWVDADAPPKRGPGRPKKADKVEESESE